MLDRDQLQELLSDLMTPTVGHLLACDNKQIFNIHSILDTVNQIKADPVRASGLLLRSLALSKRAYGQLKIRYDGLKDQLEYRQAHIKFVSQKVKEENDYAEIMAKWPPQVAFVNALAASDDGVQLIKAEMRTVKNKMSEIWDIYEICQKTLETFLTLTNNSHKLPMSGIVADVSELQDMTDAFEDSLSRVGEELE